MEQQEKDKVSLSESIWGLTYPLYLHHQVNRMLVALNFLSLGLLGVLALEHWSLYPLIEERHKWVEFMGVAESRVRVSAVEKHLTPELVRHLLERYVLARERIGEENAGQEETAWREMSSRDVLEAHKAFARRREALKGRVKRQVRIMRYQEVEEGIAELEMETEDRLDGKPWKEEKWLLTLVYGFQGQLVRDEHVSLNPAGLMVSGYIVRPQGG